MPSNDQYSTSNDQYSTGIEPYFLSRIEYNKEEIEEIL